MLNIAGASLDGLTFTPDNNKVLVVGVPGQSIASTNLCLLYFTFTPQATGTRMLSLPVASNGAAATLTLTGVGTSGTATPVVSIANAASVTEGNRGSTSMLFADHAVREAGASTVTVRYSVSGGSATSGVDYILGGTGTLTFAPEVTTQNIIVSVIGDTQVEARRKHRLGAFRASEWRDGTALPRLRA